jgi:hypothetical protein
VTTAVGLARLDEPIHGSWSLSSFPELVTLLGRTFRRATWAAPRPDVVAQYREDVDHNSMHLLVHGDGTWIIDHTDDANPDHGLVLEHTFRDVAQTTVGGLALVAALFLTTIGLSYALTRR